ncbi:CHASE2 domain-containing protein [Leptothoe spongobia]|uniref:CHASE2 domain-containing protein n=1 Tax=Leptothoe spongobia TAU-MAC 1115 TaxID=1967444 RepID=A0A947DI04_9CYAN|nr:CHASE2 domain-containing protein [Leptothoe spongobia]MBT9316905.1 CHASE2 domain-containing protein [Leptothoe spongobia TAU-MAC 1115]
MEPLVILNLGQGDCRAGLPNITAQLWLTGTTGAIKCVGWLPPAPTLPDIYQRWQRLYQALHHRLSWQNSSSTRALQFDLTTPIHVSSVDFDQLCQQLQSTLNQWLNSEGFQSIDRQLRTKLSTAEPVRIIVETDDPFLQSLPWHLWSFCDDYPATEVAIGTQEYNYATGPQSASAQKSMASVRVLAVLGHGEGIDVQRDIAILQQLPGATIQLLSEPSRPELDQWLWDTDSWDILFFAGHSTSKSADQQGRLFINPTESVSIAHLCNALKTAISRRLKLAIFNSCDGMSLGRALVALNIPQLIVMREPVPDRVAHLFVKNFLQILAEGTPLYSSVRIAREQLQGLEGQFPCASWLPVIFQNPAETPFQWPRPKNVLTSDAPGPLWVRLFKGAQPPPSRAVNWQRVMATSLLITSLIMGLRLVGRLETIELRAYDQLMRSRPPQPPDDRLLLVTIDETDIRQQSPDERRGASITDAKLDELLTTLAAHEPRVIALDLFRDFAADAKYPNLVNSLRTNDRLITICSFGETSVGAGIAPPPELPQATIKQRVGFSSSIPDRDDTIRRAVLMETSPADSSCPAGLSLGFLAVLRYLKDDNIYLSWTDENRPKLQINQVILTPLDNHTGGYHTIDDYGHQIMINFRPQAQSAKGIQVAQQISLEELLNNPVDPRLIKDRIVIIGNIDASFKDFHRTPYTQSHREKTSGVEIHAHIASHILSAVLDNQPLVWTWSQWGDGLWVLGWAFGGGVLVGQLRFWFRGVLVTGSLVILLYGSCYIVLLLGGWLPWIPALMALMGTVAVGELPLKLTTAHVKE